MKPVAFVLRVVWCAAALFAPAVLAANGTAGNTQAVMQVTVKLLDGSSISGVPQVASLPFQTEYARTDIPWGSVTACSVFSNEPSLLRLKNGDQLRGRIALDKLKLDTALGKLTVAAAEISALSVRLAGQGGLGINTEGLVLYYSFDADDGAVVRDASGQGNDGKVCGATWTPDGRHGGAYVFHGRPRRVGDCIQTPDSPSLNAPCVTKQITLTVWIKPVSLPYEIPTILCKGGNHRPATYGGYEFALDIKGGNDVGFHSGNATLGTRNAHGRWVNHHLGKWIHLAVTVDAKTQARFIYVNGQNTGDEYEWREDGYSIANALAEVPNDLFIGKPDPQHDTNRAGFDGAIDEVMIFNRVLSAEEIMTIFRREGPAAIKMPGQTAASKATPLKLRANLVDGSSLMAETKPEELALRSAALGKLAVPLAQVRELKFSEGGKQVIARLANGDLLAGAPLFTELAVVTAFGKIALHPDHLRSVNLGNGVAAPSPTPPRSTPVNRRERIRTTEL